MLTIVLAAFIGMFVGFVVMIMRDRKARRPTSAAPILLGLVAGGLVGFILATDIIPNHVVKQVSHVDSIYLERPADGDYISFALNHNDEPMYIVHQRFNAIDSLVVPDENTFIYDDLGPGQSPQMIHWRLDCESGWWDWFILCSPKDAYTIDLPKGSWTDNSKR